MMTLGLQSKYELVSLDSKGLLSPYKGGHILTTLTSHDRGILIAQSPSKDLKATLNDRFIQVTPTIIGCTMMGNTFSIRLVEIETLNSL